MKLPRPGRWGVITLLWLGLIFFSSTSRAAGWAGYTFDSIWLLTMRKWPAFSAAYNLSNYLAEKGLHVIMFATLGILLWHLIPKNPQKPWLILLIGALVGSASEFYQSFFVGRDPTVRDAFLNAGGVAIGVLLTAMTAGGERFRQVWSSSAIPELHPPEQRETDGDRYPENDSGEPVTMKKMSNREK